MTYAKSLSDDVIVVFRNHYQLVKPQANGKSEFITLKINAKTLNKIGVYGQNSKKCTSWFMLYYNPMIHHPICRVVTEQSNFHHNIYLIYLITIRCHKSS